MLSQLSPPPPFDFLAEGQTGLQFDALARLERALVAIRVHHQHTLGRIPSANLCDLLGVNSANRPGVLDAFNIEAEPKLSVVAIFATLAGYSSHYQLPFSGNQGLMMPQRRSPGLPLEQKVYLRCHSHDFDVASLHYRHASVKNVKDS